MPNAPDRNFNIVMVILAALNFITHLEEHVVPTMVMATICLSWRMLYEFQKIRMPNFYIKTLMIVGAFYIVFKTYGSLTGVESATALLISAVALKFVDSVSYRDAMIVIFLNFLLLMARFLVSQTLAMTLFAVFNLVVITALLFHLHKGKDIRFDLVTLLRNGFWLTLKTTPLLILLFFVFPRFSLGFLNLRTENVGTSGFSGRLEPGEVSKLVFSDKTAFRVSFDLIVPRQEDRYWRGEVLGINKGMRWDKANSKSHRPRAFAGDSNNLIKQEITLEPQYGRWLFGLDTPAMVKFKDWGKQNGIRLEQGSIFRTRADNGQRLIYDVYSDQKLEENLSIGMQRFYLQGVNTEDERMNALIKTFTNKTKSTKEIVDRVLDFYRKDFRYTVNPGAMDGNSVSYFVFEKKVGFCEHFAASFAYIMRASGIPSRIVLGFHGAQQNELGNYYIVKDKDAHAWTEIWSKESKSWLRVDPTEVVAPMRLQLGGEIFHSLPEGTTQSKQMTKAQLENMYQSSWFNKYLGRTRLIADVIALKWNHFLINYDAQGQRNLLSKLGLNWVKKKHLGLAASLILLLFFVGLRIRSISRLGSASPLEKIYDQFNDQMGKFGVYRLANEGPRDYVERCQQEWQNNPRLERFKTLYLETRYGPKPLESANILEMRQILKDLKKSQSQSATTKMGHSA